MKYFSSDFHLGHTKIIEMANRPFKNIDEMNEVIVSNMIKPLKPGDEFYFLGDMAFFLKFSDLFFKRLPSGVKFIWIVGNHDKKIPWKIERIYKNILIEITPMKEIKIGKKSVVMCHYPLRVWNKSHYNSWHLYGHCHNGEGYRDFISEGKMLNVNCEFNDYKPWSENDVIEYMNNRPNNYDAHCDHEWISNGNFEYCKKCKEIRNPVFK